MGESVTWSQTIKYCNQSVNTEHLDLCKGYLQGRNWSLWGQGVQDVTSLEVSKTRLNRAWSNLGLWKEPLPMARGGNGMSFKVPSNPNHSSILWNQEFPSVSTNPFPEKKVKQIFPSCCTWNIIYNSWNYRTQMIPQVCEYPLSVYSNTCRVKDFKWKDVTTDLEVFWTQIPAPDEVSSQILFKETAFYWRSGVFSWLRFGGTFSEQRSVRIFAFGWQPIEPGFLPRKNEVVLLAFPWSSTCLQT